MKARRRMNPALLVPLALLCSVVWLPAPLALARPLWILLLMLYFQVSMPAHFSVSALVLLGLLMDVLCPQVMGVHALALTIPCGILSGRARRFYFFPMPQQMLWVGALSALYQLILALLAYSTGHAMGVTAVLMPIITSTMLWPWLGYVMDR